MSQTKDDYDKYTRHMVDKESTIGKYISELELDKAELIECLKAIRDYDINDDNKETEIAQNVVSILKKHEVNP